VGTLIFTGEYRNVSGILGSWPEQKRLVCCGSGVSPFVIGPTQRDNLEDVVRLLVRSRIYNSGQDCLCTERVYVHESLFRDFEEILTIQLRALRAGQFGDSEAEICPLVPPVANRASEIMQTLRTQARTIFDPLPGDYSQNLIQPCAFELPINSPLLTLEKYAPILTIARWAVPADLIVPAASDYLFGATVLDEETASLFSEYPHLCIHNSPMDLEAKDAHVPFGGRRKSGFSQRFGSRIDGPILYSIESTESTNRKER
jgi:succinate-semialdehyde dehydrogenase/glutarate-semialdehyde dehydrogenase